MFFVIRLAGAVSVRMVDFYPQRLGWLCDCNFIFVLLAGLVLSGAYYGVGLDARAFTPRAAYERKRTVSLIVRKACPTARH